MHLIFIQVFDKIENCPLPEHTQVQKDTKQKNKLFCVRVSQNVQTGRTIDIGHVYFFLFNCLKHSNAVFHLYFIQIIFDKVFSFNSRCKKFLKYSFSITLSK